ncbi:MAG TPA: hypothetical protein VFI29_15640 [Hanamia sp.]|nr:hypothetical protein [Hanamia sp.]
MASTTDTRKKTVRSNRGPKAKPMTKVEMFQKMLDDQKIIREALRNGIPLKELEKTHGLKFATLPDAKN